MTDEETRYNSLTTRGTLITDEGSVLVLTTNNNPWWKYKTNTMAKYLMVE